MLRQPPANIETFRAASGPLACPCCQKIIPLLGRRKATRHPIAESLRERSFAITGWWTLFLALAFCCLTMISDEMPIGRALGFWLFFLPALPGFLLYFVVRLFPRYRVTNCPFCGFHELTRLDGKKIKQGCVQGHE